MGIPWEFQDPRETPSMHTLPPSCQTSCLQSAKAFQFHAVSVAQLHWCDMAEVLLPANSGQIQFPTDFNKNGLNRTDLLHLGLLLGLLQYWNNKFEHTSTWTSRIEELAKFWTGHWQEYVVRGQWWILPLETAVCGIMFYTINQI